MGKNSKTHVKKGDTVEVIAGRDKGKRGKILHVLKRQNRVIVEKIHISNVMPVDPKSGKPSRVKRRRLEDGTRVRVTQRSGELLDTV